MHPILHAPPPKEKGHQLKVKHQSPHDDATLPKLVWTSKDIEQKMQDLKAWTHVVT